MLKGENDFSKISRSGLNENVVRFLSKALALVSSFCILKFFIYLFQLLFNYFLPSLNIQNCCFRNSNLLVLANIILFLWFLLSLLLIIVDYIFWNLKTQRKQASKIIYDKYKQRVINLLALFPAIVMNLVYFAIDICVSCFIILLFFKPAHTNVKNVLFVSAFVIFLGEFIHTIGDINVSIILKFLTTKRKIASAVFTKDFEYWFIISAFWIITIGFFIISGSSLIQGFRNLDNPRAPTDIVKSGIAIISGTLAIFFTLAAVVIQNVLQKYSSAFLKQIIHHFIFVFSFFFMIALTICELYLLKFGSNNYLETFSFFATIYAVIDMGIMIWLLIYFLDVRNVVSSIARKSYSHIREIPKGTYFDISKDDKEKRYTKYKLSLFFKKWVAGNIVIPDTYSFIPPFYVLNKIKDDLRPIFSACLKALSEDNRDVVLSCLTEIRNIAFRYIERRKNYPGMQDDLLGFIAEQLDIVFNFAVRVLNQEYTNDIVSTAREIGLKCVELTPKQKPLNENSLVYPWIKFLENCAYKTVHLEHTSAPTNAIDSIKDISISLIKENAYVPSIYSGANSLKEVGVFAGKLKGIWPALICQKTVHGLVMIILSLFQKAQTGNFALETYISNLCEDIEKIFEAAYMEKRDFYTDMMISAPLVGSLWLDVKFVDIFKIAISQKYDKETSERYAINSLKRLSSCLRRVGAIVSKNQASSIPDYFESFSEIIYLIINYIIGLGQRNSSQPEEVQRLLGTANELLIESVDEANNLLTLSLESESSDRDCLYNLSAIFAFLSYYSAKNKLQIFIDGRNRFLKRILDIYNNFKSRGDEEEHKKKNLYRYLKLFGAWEYKYDRRNLLTSLVFKTLVEDYTHKLEEGGYLSMLPEMQELGYPILYNEEWELFSSYRWPDEIRSQIKDELNDIENYRRWNSLIKRCFRIKTRIWRSNG